MDLKEYFREVDAQPEIFQERIRRDSCRRQWQLLRMYSKPTIAMVNGGVLVVVSRHWWPVI